MEMEENENGEEGEDPWTAVDLLCIFPPLPSFPPAPQLTQYPAPPTLSPSLSLRPEPLTLTLSSPYVFTQAHLSLPSPALSLPSVLVHKV
ncbi:hypothetical protein E2C01_020139 [Portunus trituberculatus]|uniref:Uncharacterized protein n=1 Tax=Portunus trituberculatus TaxID=210409 RepID=A0A5B7E0X9_PORTR|nr:hypothetical protein [Portunus trituberculatus]